VFTVVHRLSRGMRTQSAWRWQGLRTIPGSLHVFHKFGVATTHGMGAPCELVHGALCFLREANSSVLASNGTIAISRSEVIAASVDRVGYTYHTGVVPYLSTTNFNISPDLLGVYGR
jgi:hypothetical protein